MPGRAVRPLVLLYRKAKEGQEELRPWEKQACLLRTPLKPSHGQHDGPHHAMLFLGAEVMGPGGVTSGRGPQGSI